MKWVVPVLVSILILGGMGLTQPTFAQIPAGFSDFNGHCYAKTAASSWETTELEAVSFGGHLVTINDLAENDFVFALNGGTGGTGGSGGTGAWIGYNDVAVEGTFEWVSGIVTGTPGTPGYENWGVGEPNAFTGEDAAVMLGDGSWNDLTNFSSVVGIMELDTTCATAFASEHFIFDDFTVPVAGESFLASTVGVFTAFTDTDVNTSLPFVLNRNTEVDLFSSSPMQIELNVASNGLLRAVTFNSPGTYELLLDYTSTTSLDITPVLSYEFLFTSNNDASLLAGIDAIDINGNTLTCTDKSVPVSTLPFTVSFDLGTDCSAPVLDPAQVDTLSFFMFNSNTQGVFEVDAIQSTLSATVPDAPTGLTATTGPASGEVTLSWNVPLNDGGSPITDYRVLFSTDGGGTFSEFSLIPHPASSIVVTGLSPGALVDFRVNAVNVVGNSLFATVTGTAGASTNASPVISFNPITTSIEFATASFSFTASDDGQPGSGLTWSVTQSSPPFASISPIFGTCISTVNCSDVFNIIFNIVGTYDFILGVFDGTTTTIQLFTVTVIAPATTVPDAPTGLIATTGPAAGEVTLTWTAPINEGSNPITDYRINSSLDGGVTFVEFIHTPSTATSIVVTGLSEGVSFDFHVHAINLVGDSLPSAIATATAGIGGSVGTGPTITQIIDSTGDGLGNTLVSAFAIDTDSSGNVFVTGNAGDNAFKIATDGTITEIIDATGGGLGILDEPFDLATDSLGNVYVSELQNGNVFKIVTPGTCSTTTVPPCVITRIVAGGSGVISGPLGVATDSLDNVYVGAFFTDNVIKIATDGTITEIMDSSGDGVNPLTDPRRLATDSAGNVYVPGQTSNNVFKIDTPGTCSTTGTPCTITQIIDSTGDGLGNTFSSPNKVATDSLGNVFVTGNISDNAFKIAPDGTITQIIDATGDGLGNTLDGTNGIATDSSGIVYVTGAGSANAFAIAPDGFIFEIIDGTGDGVNSLVNAGGIATDSFGHVFVVGVTSGNVFEIDFFGDSAIGGTLISIDTVALLLAGVQSISMWMIPVVVAGVVIGVFVIKRRK